MVVALSRVRVVWSGVIGGTGVSTFYANAGQTPDLARLRAALAAVAPGIYPGVTMAIQNQGDIIQDETGDIVGTWSGPAQTVVTGTGTGAAHLAGGGVCTWMTETIAKGRHLRGRTFLVPFAGVMYGGNGRLTTGAVATSKGFGDALLASPTAPWAVWSRPTRVKNPDGTSSVTGPGSSGIITAHRETDLPVVLRSRRD